MSVARLVERDAEITFLEERLSDCLHEKGSIVVIGGAVASGKTAMLLSFAERAASSGAIFLTATASRLEQTLQLGIINQLLRSGELPVAISERSVMLLADEAISRLAQEQDPAVMTPAVAHVFEGLWKLLRDLSQSRPVVLTVDDIQYADVTSTQFLAYLARRARDSRIFIVLTECTQLLPDHLLYAEILCQPNCHCIALHWLSAKGVARLLRARLPGASRPLAMSCHQISGGNPLLAQALIEDYCACPSAPGDAMVPRTAFGRAVRACLYRCDPFGAELARMLAVLETTPSAELLGELLGASPESVGKGVQILSAMGILDDGRFRHHATRRAVLDSMGASEVAALHSRIARVFYLAGTSSAIVARHLLVADCIEPPGRCRSWKMPRRRHWPDGGSTSPSVTSGERMTRAAMKDNGLR